jgi:hypothetical protein
MNSTRLTVAALAIASAFAPAAYAQDQKMTEVVITANRVAAERASVAGFSEQPLLQTPASVSVLTREQLQELNIRSTTDAAKFDASIGDAYNAVGYAEQFSIRGYKLDNASSYRKDGHAISGDTQIPLENKESIEVLRGLAGLQAGVAAPGGIVNYVTKRPTENNLRSVLFEVSERGSVLGTVDLGGRFEDRRFGYRINAAGERMRSIIKGADGHRSFVSTAFDWRISAGTAADRCRLPEEVAEIRAWLPADRRHQPAGGRCRHLPERPAVGQAGGNGEQQFRHLLPVPACAGVESHGQRQPAPLQARRLYSFPLRLFERRTVAGLLHQWRLRCVRLPQPGRREEATVRQGPAERPLCHRRPAP